MYDSDIFVYTCYLVYFSLNFRRTYNVPAVAIVSNFTFLRRVQQTGDCWCYACCVSQLSILEAGVTRYVSTKKNGVSGTLFEFLYASQFFSGI